MLSNFIFFIDKSDLKRSKQFHRICTVEVLVAGAQFLEIGG